MPLAAAETFIRAWLDGVWQWFHPSQQGQSNAPVQPNAAAAAAVDDMALPVSDTILAKLSQPATLFTVACASVSVLALTAAWRLHDRTGRDAVRRRAAQKRLRTAAASSSSPRDEYLATIALAISNCSACLQTCSALGAAGEHHVAVVSKLTSDVAETITSLCQMQQVLSLHYLVIGSEQGMRSCLDTVLAGLAETISLLVTELATLGRLERSSLQADEALVEVERLAQILKDQRESLAFVVDSIQRKVDGSKLPASQLEPGKLEPGHNSSLPSGDLKTFLENAPEFDRLPEYSAREDGAVVAPDSKDPTAFAVEIDSQPIEQPTLKAIEGAEVFAAIKANQIDELDLLLQDGDANLVHGRLQRTAMHEAARLNRTNCATKLLHHGALVDKEDGKGDSPLHLAAWEGHVEVASVLLSADADIDRLSGRDGNTPLLCAIVGRHIDMARALLRRGARVSARSPTDMFPLHQAAITGQSAMCELLLDRGANVDCRDGEGNTPLHYAATIGDVRTVNVLLKEGADVNCRQEKDLTPLHWACHKGHNETVKLLLRHDAAIDAKSDSFATPLHCAAAGGHLGCVKTLMSHGADGRVVTSAWDGMAGRAEEIARARGYTSISMLIRGFSEAG